MRLRLDPSATLRMTEGGVPVLGASHVTALLVPCLGGFLRCCAPQNAVWRIEPALLYDRIW